MTAPSPLALRHVPMAHAAAARTLGRGLELGYSVGATQGHLQLQPLPDDTGHCPGTALQTASGWIWLTDASAALSLLGSVPALLGGEPRPWYWQHWNQGLAPQLRDALGGLEPLASSLLAPPDALGCRATITLGAQVVTALVHASPSTWLRIFEQARFTPLLAPMPEDLRVRVPVRLGQSALAAGALRRVRPGDVVLVEQPFFDTEGRGQLQLGPWRCHGRLQSQGLEVFFTLDQMEHAPVDDDDYESQDYGFDGAPDGYGDSEQTHDYPAPGASTAHQEGQEDPAGEYDNERLDGLALNLSLRCGSLKLTMAELRQLGPGSVLTVAGIRPGAAALYYGERPVAHGELVDIEGQLGLQITRMEPL